MTIMIYEWQYTDGTNCLVFKRFILAVFEQPGLVGGNNRRALSPACPCQGRFLKLVTFRGSTRIADIA